MPQDFHKSPEEQLRAVHEALSEVIPLLSDKEIADELRADGEDPDAIAEQTRQIMLSAVKTYQREQLQAATARHTARITELFQKKTNLPSTPEGRRELLAAVFANIPDMQSAVLTAHHREFTDLTDADVEDYLADLAALGVLDQLQGPTNLG
jgi:hypothetical protein